VIKSKADLRKDYSFFGLLILDIEAMKGDTQKNNIL
jgi:hypothetical protein